MGKIQIKSVYKCGDSDGIGAITKSVDGSAAGTTINLPAAYGQSQEMVPVLDSKLLV